MAERLLEFKEVSGSTQTDIDLDHRAADEPTAAPEDDGRGKRRWPFGKKAVEDPWEPQGAAAAPGSLRAKYGDDFQDPDGNRIQAGGGGRVRRVVFDDEPGEEAVTVERHYAPRHRAPIDAIEREVDHLRSYRAWKADRAYRYRAMRDEALGRDGGDRRGSTLYETRYGSVSDGYMPDERRGRRRVFYVDDRGYPGRSRRFVSSMVDPLIKDVRLEEERIVREEVTEYETRRREVLEDDDGTMHAVETSGAAKPKKARRAKKAAKPKKEKPPKKAKKAKKAKQPKKAKAAKSAAKVEAKPAAATKGPAKKAAKKAAKAEAYYAFRGDVHPVIEIEGIGPKYAEALQKVGIETTARLLYEDGATVARKVKAPTKTVRQWQSMSELALVKGIGPQYAEALARAGIDGIQDLKDMEADAIAKKVNTYLDGLDVKVIGTRITANRIKTWQAAAAKMRKVRTKVPAA